MSIRCTDHRGHVVGHLHREHVRLFLQQQVAELSSAAEKEVPQPAGPQPQPEGSQGVQDGRGQDDWQDGLHLPMRLISRLNNLTYQRVNLHLCIKKNYIYICVLKPPPSILPKKR